ncbi:hypothetical protein [Paracoccus sp. MKU1]|uniref:hypothetical protein n=1 Tax=Paracoccus sp. MKU1 TaxID=1745182 RepID=UPI0007192A07|nr:hypothetical protein [Paracoccus sp. MKU1]KRW94304.1 hypothetical protein AQY21_20455 [Paracoccus sp. MKU1]
MSRRYAQGAVAVAATATAGAVIAALEAMKAVLGVYPAIVAAFTLSALCLALLVMIHRSENRK